MELHATISQWYGLGIIFIALAWQTFRVLRWALRALLSPLAFFCVEWLAASLRRTFPTTAISEFDIIFVVLYVTANAICMSMRVNDLAEVAMRSGILATINLVPLLVGIQLSDVADFLGITLRMPKIMHRWIGCMTLVEATIHIIARALTAGLPWNSLVKSGTVVSLCCWNGIHWKLTPFYASVALTFTALLTVPGTRRRFYECFLALHILITGVAVSALWRHLSSRQFEARFYVLGGVVFWASWLLVGLLLDGCYIINLGRGSWLPRVRIVTFYRSQNGDQVVMTGACHLEIQLRRLWDVQPGQYLFVTIPRLGILSSFQRHPFWIVWWENDPKRGMMQLDMLVRKRRGFTRRLLSYRDDEYVTWISRPFGRSENFGDYGSVLMLATDVGITAHLPYLKSLMQGRLEASIRTRRVVVIWQVQDSSKFLGRRHYFHGTDTQLRS